MNIEKQNLSTWLELIFNTENVKIVSLHLQVKHESEINILLKRSCDYLNPTSQKIEDVFIEFDLVKITNQRQAKQKNTSTLELARYTKLCVIIETMMKFNEIPTTSQPADDIVRAIMDVIVCNSNINSEDMINEKYPFTTNYNNNEYFFTLSIYAGEQEKLLVEQNN